MAISLSCENLPISGNLQEISTNSIKSSPNAKQLQIILRFTKTFVIIMKFTFLFIAGLCWSFLTFGQQDLAKSPFRQDSIGFISQPSGYRMAGTLSFPAKKGKFPAVILVWGTGPHTRDEVISKFPTFRIIADYFNQIGYAVMRIDKRGFGKSAAPGGESETVTTTADLVGYPVPYYRSLVANQ
jgi:hypothetical protein